MDFGQLLMRVYGDEQVKVLVLLTLANVLVGLARAAMAGFRLAKVADWMKQVLVWFAGYGALYLVTLAQPEMQLGGITPKDAGFAFIVLALLGYVFQNVKDMGMKLPDFMGGRSRVLGTGGDLEIGHAEIRDADVIGRSP